MVSFFGKWLAGRTSYRFDAVSAVALLAFRVDDRPEGPTRPKQRRTQTSRSSLWRYIEDSESSRKLDLSGIHAVSLDAFIALEKQPRTDSLTSTTISSRISSDLPTKTILPRRSTKSISAPRRWLVLLIKSYAPQRCSYRRRNSCRITMAPILARICR